MSNSPLVSYTAISPNSNARTQRITKITPHHMAGNLTVEQCGAVFASSARQASSNYGIGSDGRIALYVPEDRRSWASSSAWNDQRAVTIEVANSSTGGEWPVSDAAWASLVELCADICRRNGIERLEYTGGSSGSLTEHRMFAATMCPGPFLHDRMGQLADEVNAKLHGEEDDMFDDEARGMLRTIYAILTDRSDPTGRGKEMEPLARIPWFAAKQEQEMADVAEIKADVSEIKAAIVDDDAVGGTD